MENENISGRLVSEGLQEQLIAGVGAVNLNLSMTTTVNVKAEEEKLELKKKI